MGIALFRARSASGPLDQTVRPSAWTVQARAHSKKEKKKGDARATTIGPDRSNPSTPTANTIGPEHTHTDRPSRVTSIGPSGLVGPELTPSHRRARSLPHFRPCGFDRAPSGPSTPTDPTDRECIGPEPQTGPTVHPHAIGPEHTDRPSTHAIGPEHTDRPSTCKSGPSTQTVPPRLHRARSPTRFRPCVSTTPTAVHRARAHRPSHPSSGLPVGLVGPERSDRAPSGPITHFRPNSIGPERLLRTFPPGPTAPTGPKPTPPDFKHRAVSTLRFAAGSRPHPAKPQHPGFPCGPPPWY